MIEEGLISIETEEKYNQHLDSMHSPITVCGLIYPASFVLDRVNREKYNEGLGKFIETELGGKYE